MGWNDEAKGRGPCPGNDKGSLKMGDARIRSHPKKDNKLY